jgi:hypothetical protein
VKECGADVNMQCGSYGSALGAASITGQQEVVEFFVKEGGANVNMQLQYGIYGSALAAASHEGHQEAVRFLVKEGGANVNMQLQYGIYGSALAAATGLHWDEILIPTIIGILVNEWGAEVNMQLQYGKYANALDAGERNIRHEAAQLLIKLGARREERQSKVVEEGESARVDILN